MGGLAKTSKNFLILLLKNDNKIYYSKNFY